MFHELHAAREHFGGKKVPQFSHIRDNLYKTKVPPVNLEIGFKSKDGEITVLKDVTTAPNSRYPPSSFDRLYEIASVDVSIYIYIERDILFVYLSFRTWLRTLWT